MTGPLDFLHIARETCADDRAHVAAVTAAVDAELDPALWLGRKHRADVPVDTTLLQVAGRHV